MSASFADRLSRIIADAWTASDPALRVIARPREGDKVDITIVSRLFEGRDSQEREALLWSILGGVPREEMVHMTYSLMLTPEEVQRYFSGQKTVDETADEAEEDE